VTPFEELDTCLGQQVPDALWSEDCIFLALELLDKLGPQDWGLVETNWAARPAIWQRHLASILGNGEPAKAAPLLLAFLASPDDKLVEQAIDSLSATFHDVPLEVGGDVEARLQKLAESKSPQGAALIREVLQRLTVKR
jgi:hypothetical protein